MHLILNTNFNNAFKITLFGMPGGTFFMCSLPLTLEPGYATDWSADMVMVIVIFQSGPGASGGASHFQLDS